jgi:multidrug efflux pump subunit AcrA (membrane-fusion protein)
MFRDTEFRKAVTPQLSTELDALTKLIEGKKTAEVDVAQAKLRSARESREQKLRTGSQAARREIEKGLKIDKSAARRVRRYLGR